MQLRTVDGNLTLSSVYKLVVWGWLLGWSVFLIPIMIIIGAGALLSGEINDNGNIVRGVGPVFMVLLPMLLAPVIIVLQSFIVGIAVTCGLWFYRHWRPLTVEPR